MDKLLDLIAAIQWRLKKWDKTKFLRELREFSRLLLKQIFNQIPGVSAATGLIAGAWIASTFTTSPIRAKLAGWGFIEGGTHVVSGFMYGVMSIVVPLLTAGVTAYFVQKFLKRSRTLRMEKNRNLLSHADQDLKDALKGKLLLLEKAFLAGILTDSEYQTKKANLYQTYARNIPDKLRELLINKLTS